MRKVGYHSSPTLIPNRQTRQILNVVPLSVSSSVASSHHLRAPGAFIRIEQPLSRVVRRVASSAAASRLNLSPQSTVFLALT